MGNESTEISAPNFSGHSANLLFLRHALYFDLSVSFLNKVNPRYPSSRLAISGYSD